MPSMSITSAHERPQPPTAPGFCDTISFSFADATAGVFGTARIGLSCASGGTAVSSGAAIVFADGGLSTSRAAGGVPLAAAADGFEDVEAAGVRTTTVTALDHWTLRVAGDHDVALELSFNAVSEAAPTAGDSAVARVGGLQGYEHLCRVTGSARVGGSTLAVDCLGQRGHWWGVPDHRRVTLVRTVSVWAGEDLAVCLTAVRPVKARSHADEALQVAILVAPPEDAGDDRARGVALPEDAGDNRARVVVPEDARLSTTYDAQGRHRRAGLELYEDADGYPRRGAGDMICATSLDLGGQRLDCSFFRWRLDGRDGLGRYDVLRPVPDAP